jgi:hypothetical protein
MRNAVDHFALLIAIAVMILAIAALPGRSRMILVVPAALGAIWAAVRIRRSPRAQGHEVTSLCGSHGAAEQGDEADER